jgi:ATP-dependent Clp protease ATP-binding subunit ClpB
MRYIPVIPLNLDIQSDEALEFEQELKNRIVHQDEAVKTVSDIYEQYLAGMQSANRPLGIILLLGCTGTGKTKLCESIADVLYGDPEAMIKFNCGEYQSSHEISKLIGAPPSYVGHGEKNSASQLSQEKLDKHHTEKTKISIVLFDEIEKASSAFHDLLLGILDKGTLNTGKGDTIDFTKSIILMTSNVGSDELNKANGAKLGFNTPINTRNSVVTAAKNAATKRFSPEFINRLDKMIVFNNLSKEQLKDILKVELRNVQRRIFASTNHCQFVLTLNAAAEEFIIDSGYDIRYGARHLKRSLEKHIVSKLARLMLTGQIEMGDVLHIDVDPNGLLFHKIAAGDIIEKDNESDFFGFLEPNSESTYEVEHS